MTDATKALFAAIGAFTLWGLLPIFWKLFPELSGVDLFIYRLFWSLITLSIIVVLRGKTTQLKAILQSNNKKWLLLSALLISSNWLMYTIAVTQDRIIEASLGYFLSPIINVLLGYIFLKERIRSLQLPSILFACIGVVWMGLSSGVESFPWIALMLSLTFAAYGLIRKITHVGSLEGLTYETSIVFLPFIAWWFYQGANITNNLEVLGTYKMLLLSLAGIITCTPLILFAYAAKRLSLQTIGFIQYLSPTFKFLCGWAIYNEVMTPDRWSGFIFIWAGLIWYSLEGFYASKKRKSKLAQPVEAL
jgi:chloramphenicol-sensitive protein RarD